MQRSKSSIQSNQDTRAPRTIVLPLVLAHADALAVVILASHDGTDIVETGWPSVIHVPALVAHNVELLFIKRRTANAQQTSAAFCRPKFQKTSRILSFSHYSLDLGCVQAHRCASGLATFSVRKRSVLSPRSDALSGNFDLPARAGGAVGSGRSAWFKCRYEHGLANGA